MLSSPQINGARRCNSYTQTSFKHQNSEDQTALDEKLDWLTVDHDDLMQELSQRISTPKYHPSMAVIDKWELEAIERIRQAAVLARRTLVDALDQHVTEVKKTLSTLTPKLREARGRTVPFKETHIQEWANLLQELKKIPVLPVSIDQENNIHGLSIDLRKQQTIPCSPSCRIERPSDALVSIIRDPLLSPTPPSSSPEDIKTKSDANCRKVKFDVVSSFRSETITPGGVTIIREEKKTANITSDIRRADAEIPIDLRTHHSLRRLNGTH
jgi:hypothetical protein